ncbi:S9 family peptidase [Gelidibacter salicanalis]|nr:prolyl oligopeptidase family serine peptidase [Gelidibacter salicanalis]
MDKSQQILSLNPIVFFIYFFSALALAQAPASKKLYKKELDTVWSKNIYIQNLSSDGRWVTLKKFNYKNKESYLLLNTENADTISLGHVSSISYSNNSAWTGYMDKDRTFTLLNLTNGVKTNYRNVNKFNFDSTGGYLALLIQNSEHLNVLQVINLNNLSIWEENGVVDYQWLPHLPKIVITKKVQNNSKISLYDFRDNIANTIKEYSKNSYSHITISKEGQSIVFLEKENNSYSLISYSCPTGKSEVLNNKELQVQLPMTNISNKDLYISDNGLAIFFYRRSADTTSVPQTAMEVWKSSDPWILPRMQHYSKNEQTYLLTVWDINTGSITPISDMEHPTVQYNPNHDHAVVYDKMLYEPQYKQYEDVDLYLRDFKTGNKKLITERQYNEQGFISLSPNGRYVAYFKDQVWWAYDSKSFKTIALTQNLDISFERDNNSGVKDNSPYGIPGWSEDERYAIIYDEYDIWLIEINGSCKKRITNGREENIVYRISRDQGRNDIQYLNLLNNHSGIGYNLNEGFILELTSDNFDTGYSFWNEGSGLKKIFYENAIVEDVLIKNDIIVFKRNEFNIPSAIFKMNVKNMQLEMLYQSDSELLNYDLGGKRFINYRIADGTTLRGLLFYPANFNSTKTYPMIVKLYEKVIKHDLLYFPPSDYEYTGFNLLRYLTNDYFVFIPTIAYEIKNPGKSVIKSVMPAINKILEEFPIDKTRIGLFGHSFGGYEAAFLVTQTNLFAAAVAGSPVTNLTQYYHDIGWDWRKEQIWRIENQQFRMGDSYYNLKENYKMNSPLNYIEKLNTPLMLWTGKKDNNVNWTQSINMFMAMKRLNKIGELVLFENESHYLLNPENQENLSIKIFNWFKFYLKKEWSD